MGLFVYSFFFVMKSKNKENLENMFDSHFFSCSEKNMDENTENTK